MGYFILALTIIVYLIRPAEWLPGLFFNWNMLLNICGVLFLLNIAANNKKKFSYDRTSIFLLGFIVAMMASNVANFQFMTIVDYFTQVVSLLIVYLLTQISITTSQQINRIIIIILSCILFICYQCYLQASIGENWGGLEPIYRRLLLSNDHLKEVQVRWYGVLHDPNDLGMLLISFMPYILNKILYQNLSVFSRGIWSFSMLTIGYTVFLTNSRGTFLALICAFSFFYIIKRRSLIGLISAGVVTLLLLALGPSRMAETTSGDYSAMGRIDAWILAIELFAMNPVFGIGSRHFLDYHGLTTHNSYVLAFVENGAVGFVAYLSLFILAVNTGISCAYTEKDNKRSIEIISLVSGLIGILVSIFFISRTYVLLPFLYIAILTTYLRIYCPNIYNKEIHSLSLIKLSTFCFCFIVFIYIFIRFTTALLL